MPGSQLLYAALVRGIRALAPAVAPLVGGRDSKLARGTAGRRGAAERLAAWGREHRDGDRPLVWFHAPSVGEGLQARAVMEAMGRLGPLQAVYTHFSPSAEGLARRMPADVADYLPWDVAGEMAGVLDGIRPDLLAFTKTEVWPALVDEAAARGIPAVLVAATLPEGSSRLRWPARAVLRSAFRRLRLVLAIAGEDGRRFERLGVPPRRVEVSGDPGIDSAASRARATDPDAPWIRPFCRPGRPTVVAGSTWPPDEGVLVEAFARIREELPGARLVVAPHEPDEGHLVPLEEALRRIGATVRRLETVQTVGEAGDADAVVVDRVGVLAQLYTVGTAAYVGGGFHDQGLHSVLEPAAAGLPVAFGPRHGNARAAHELAVAGGGAVVENAGELARILLRWLTDDGARATSGASAAGYIEAHLGAAERTARRLRELLP